MTDLIDERGHTRAQAQAQHPTLDLNAKPASEETPVGANTLVPAQSPAEVQAQIDNAAGTPGEAHDQAEQMGAAATLGSDEAADTLGSDEDEGDEDGSYVYPELKDESEDESDEQEGDQQGDEAP